MIDSHSCLQISRFADGRFFYVLMCVECGEEAKAGLSRYQDMLPERSYCISGDSLKDCNVVGESFVLIAEKVVFLWRTSAMEFGKQDESCCGNG